MQLGSHHSLEKVSITSWLISAFSWIRLFLFDGADERAPTCGKEGGDKTQRPGPCFSQVCWDPPYLCHLHLSTWTLLCPFPGQRQKHKTWGHLLPPVLWRAPLLPCSCWMPANLILRWSITQFTWYLQQSQLHHFNLTFTASFSYFQADCLKCIAFENRQRGVIKCT